MDISLLQKILFILWSPLAICVEILLFQNFVNSISFIRIKESLKRKQEKNKKKHLYKDTSKKQIKKYNKKRGNINFEALKFEYSAICEIVEKAYTCVVVDKITEKLSTNLNIYLINFDIYYKRKIKYNKSKFSDIYSLDTLACLIKALIDEPLIREESKLNLKILDNVIEFFKLEDITYDNLSLSKYTKDDLLLEMQENYKLYDDDIFLIAMYLIEKIM